VLDGPDLTSPRPFVHGSGRVTFAALSPDGATLATVNDLVGEVALWDVDSGALLRVISRAPSFPSLYDLGDVAFSSDGSLLAVVGASDLDVYEVATGLPLPISARDDMGGGNRVAFVADDTRLVVGRFDFWGNGPYVGWGHVHILDPLSGALAQVLDVNMYIAIPQIVTSRDGSTLAVNSVDGTVVFDAFTGVQKPQAALPGLPGGLSPDGSQVLLLGGLDVPAAIVREVADGSEVSRVTTDPQLGPGLTTPDFSQVVFSGGWAEPDAVLLAYGLGTGALDARVCGHGQLDTVERFGLTADGSVLVTSADYPATLTLAWDVATGALLPDVPEVDFSAPSPVSPDGTLVAERASTPGYFNVFRTSDHAPVRQLGPHLTRIAELAWSPDSGLVASTSEQDPVDRGAHAVVKLWSLATGRLEQAIPTVTSHAPRFHPDGRRVFVPQLGSTLVWCR
jgi:WD40 repeat protein